MIKRIKNLNPSILILIFSIIIFFPVLFLGKALFYRDISIHYYPLTQYVIDTIKHGEFPLWNPYIFSGYEQMAGLEPPVFYPINLLFFIFPFHISLALSLIIHYFLAGLGMYYIGKHFGLSKISSFTGAVIFSLNGYMFELNSFVYLVYAIAWIPYIFLFTDKFINNPNLKDFNYLILFSVLQISTGRLDYFYLTQIFIWLWAIYKIISQRNDYKNGIFNLIKNHTYLVSAFIISALILAIQIIPSLTFIGTTRRSESMDLSIATIWSLHPLHLLNLIFNNFFGDLFKEKFLSVILTDRKSLTFFIYNLYLGIPAVFIIIFGIKSRFKNSLFFILSFLFFLVLSLGRFTFIYEFFFTYFPKFNMTRYPEKIFIYSIFSLSILSGFGMEYLKTLDKSKFIKPLFIISSLLLVSTIIFVAGNESITSYLNILCDLNLQNINFIIESITRSLVLVLLLVILIKYAKINPIYILALVICLDLTINNLNNLWTVDKDEFYKKPEIVNDIERLIGDKKLYNILQDNESNVPPIDSSKIISDFKNTIESNNYNRSVLYKLHNGFGYYPGEPIRITMANAALNDEIPGLKLSNQSKAAIMRVMGIRFYIWHTYNSTTSPPDIDNFNMIKEYKESGLQLWEVKDYKSRISFKTKALITNDDTNILKAFLIADKYSLDNDTFLLYDNSDYRKVNSLIKKQEIKNVVQEIKLVNETSNKVTIDLKTDKSGYLVLANRYSEGWFAFVNGNKFPVLKANYYQQAVRVGAGINHIELKYEPTIFTHSLYITIVGVFLFIALLIISYLPNNLLKKLNSKDIPILLIVTLFIISIISIPTLINYINTPENMTFIGIDGIDSESGSDLFTYLSKMNQGYLGNILYTNLYTPEKSYPTALFIIYLLIGNICRLFNSNIVLFYYLANYIFDLLLIYQLIRFSSIYFQEIKFKILTIILCTLSTGYSYIYLIFPKIADNIKVSQMSADIIFPEFSLITSMIDVCHFPLCISIMLFIFSKIVKGIVSKKDLFFTCFSVMMLALIHPFDYITVVSVSFCFYLLYFYLEKEKNYTIIIKPLLVILTGFIPITYIYYVLNNNNVLKLTLKKTNILLSPSIHQYFMGYGTHIILCMVCIYFIVSKRIKLNREIMFLIVWIITNFILLYSPFDFQRRFMMGLQIPIIIMSVIAIKYIIENKKLLFRSVFIFIIFISCFPTTIKILYSRTYNSTLYMPSDYKNIIEWVENKNIIDKNFFCLSKTSLFIPAFTYNRVFVGHWSETIDFVERNKIVNNFFKLNEQNQKNILKNLSIDYIIYGPEEKKLGNLYTSNFKTIYSVGEYDLIKIK